MDTVKHLTGLVALVFLISCGGGGGGGGATTTTNSELTIFQMMPGRWNLTRTDAYSTCSSLDLSSSLGTFTRIMNTREAGTLKYFDLMSSDGSGQVEYQVTKDGDPLEGERNFTDSSNAGSSCVWNNKRTYELTKISASQLDGTQKTEITSNFSYCEQCSYQFKVSFAKVSDSVTPIP